MKRIVEHYRIGAIADTHHRKDLAEKIKYALFDTEKNVLWKENLKLAAKELCWENEEVILQEIYKPFLFGKARRYPLMFLVIG